MPIYLGILALIEGACIFMSFYAGVYLRFGGDLEGASLSVGSLTPRALIFAGLLLVTMLAVGLYRRRQKTLIAETLIRLLTSVALAAFANATVYYLVPEVATGRGALALAFLIVIPVLAVTRAGFYSIVDSDRFKRNILVLGGGDTAMSLINLCDSLGQRSFRVAGYLALEQRAKIEQFCQASTQSLPELVENNRIDEIVVAMDNRRERFPARELLDCRLKGIKITEVLTFVERETGRIDLAALRPAWLIYGHGFRQGLLQKSFKRVFDVSASIALLILTLPVLAVAALAIIVESRGRGGILYRQRRVGIEGTTFELLKLRSMIPDAEGDGRARWASDNDPRITRVGRLLRRLRIDELPQVLNILRGEMSFVGPRPERPEFVAKLAKLLPFYPERNCVKPGLTGWAQLSYPYGASVEDARQKLQYDLYYVKNHSPLFDLFILLQTLDVVIWGRKRSLENEVLRDNSPQRTVRQIM